MMMIRALLTVGLVGLGGCSGLDQAPVGRPVVAPAVPGTAAVGDREDLDTPNSFPGTTRQGTVVGVETDIVGVTHLPP